MNPSPRSPKINKLRENLKRALVNDKVIQSSPAVREAKNGKRAKP